jgi:deazaflavin-dependent oxidoreductase (nitroreductase family)
MTEPTNESADLSQGWNENRDQARSGGQGGLRYVAPDRKTHRLNKLITGLARVGITVKGTHVLYVRGRSSGEWRTTPVDFFEFGGDRYLVAPRGVTQWVRNLRVAGEGKLRAGWRTISFTAAELPDDVKEPILRSYIKKWPLDIDEFFDGVHADAPAEDIVRIAPNHPVFRLTIS